MGKITLGSKIKQARLDKGMTQQEVVGDFITRNMLSKIENDVANPSIKTIEFLAKKLNKPVSYFLEDMISTTLDTKSNAELTFEHSSYMIKNNELDKCISYLEDILSKSTYNSSDIYYGRILYNLGLCHRKKSNLDEAEEYILRSINILEKNDDYYYLVKSNYEYAAINFFRDDYKPAEIHLKNAIAYLNKSYIQDVVTEVELHYNLSLSLYKQHEDEEALKTALYSIEISRRSHYFYHISAAHMLVARVYSKLNNLSKAIDHIKKAIFFFDLNEEFDLKADCQNNLGLYYYRTKQYTKAKEQLEEAMVYYNANGKLKDYHSAKVDYLRILIDEENYSEALGYSNEINREYINNTELSYLYSSLGKAYLGVGELEKSIDYLLEAENIANDTDNFNLLATIYSSLADLYSKKEDYKNAYLYSNKSSEFFKKAADSKECSNKRS